MRRRALTWVAGILAGVALPSGVVAGSQGLEPPFPAASDQPTPAIAVIERQPVPRVKLVLSPDPNATEVASCVVLPGGTRSEGSRELGFADLARAHVLLRTPGLSAPEGTSMLTSRGAVLSDVLDRDAVSFCVTLPSRELPLALWLAARRLSTPPPSKEAVEEAANSARNAALQALGDSPSLAGRTRLEQLAFQGYPDMEAPPVAGALLLDARDTRSVADYFTRIYRESAATVTVVGRFDPAYAERVARNQFQSLAPQRPAPPPKRTEQTAEQKNGRYSFLTHDRAENVDLYFGWVTPETGTQEHDALVLASTLLAGREGARLTERLVRKMQWASTVDGWVGESSGPNLFGLRISMAKRVDLDAVARIVAEELQRLAAVAPTQDELGRAAALAESGRLEREASLQARARTVGLRTLDSSGAESSQRASSQFERLAPADVSAAVRRYLGTYRTSLVEVYPKKYPIEPSTVAMKRFYLVQDGDTLIGIARAHGVALETLVAANGLRPKSPIVPGQKLVIPPGGKAPPKPTTYVVRKGDSLSRIAQKHGVTTGDLARANRIGKKKTISVGQVLVIPPKLEQ